MKVEDLCGSVFSAELDKLREIKEVRATMLKRQKGEARLMRGWLLAGLAMIMVGAAMLGLAFSVPKTVETSFLYRSEGVIKPDESPMIFEFLGVGGPDSNNGTLTDRIDYDFREMDTNRGNNFVEKVEGGYRKYTLYDMRQHSHPSAIDWHFGLGTMFLIGGLACFYIARRWR
ncbi:hypothetical protein [Kordiimonas lacus]|uniref:Uncharacterized protein n=1 Tax=Kordiimonas lacus TaxID=637679 RepID=A0A1G6TAB3_9PROT|nr:hypothetical protein [Kordiimonas lacus]SDD25506.1 hypothetical protein SAMN04488071_0159 [Kordiimonas lacus]